jgi:hypothetical protein
MTNNRVLAAAFGVLLVGWFMIRHTLGFYTGVPAFLVWEDFVTYLLVLIFTPAVMSKTRWTAPGLMVAGAIRILMGLYGLYTALTLAPSKAYGPGVAVVLALLITYFSFRAYREK